MIFLTLALVAAAVCVLAAVFRAARTGGPRRFGAWCGAAEPSRELVARHEQHCPDCQSIITRLKETT